MPDLLDRSAFKLNFNDGQSQAMGDNGDGSPTVPGEDLAQRLEYPLLDLPDGFTSGRCHIDRIGAAPDISLRIRGLDFFEQFAFPFPLIDFPQAGVEGYGSAAGLGDRLSGFNGTRQVAAVDLIYLFDP
jgi:hypothetical protein